VFGLQRFKIAGDVPIPPGQHQVRVEFGYDGGGLGKGGTVILYLDGAQSGQGRVDRTEPMVFSGDDKTDVGTDLGTHVSDDYGPDGPAFTARIDWIQIDLDVAAQDADHLITPEERWQIAMALQ
jgi:hypothetical protein